MKSIKVKNEKINPNSKEIQKLKEIAYHETSRAVISYLNKIPIKKVSIIPDELEGTAVYMENSPTYYKIFDFRTQTNKYVRSEPYEYSDNKKMKMIMVFLAGYIAGNILKKRKGLDLSMPDHQAAFDYAADCCGSTDETNALVTYLWYKTYNKMKAEETWLLVETLASELLEKKEMRGDV